MICSKCYSGHLSHSNKLIILDDIREELIQMENILEKKI